MTLRNHPLVRVLRDDRLHAGRVFDVVRRSVQLPSGLRQDWDLIDHGGAAAVAAVTDAGELVVVRQYRAAVGDWTVEIPAGRLDPGEDPLSAARRELEEEAGMVARTWTPLSTFLPAPGFCSEVLHVFEACGLEDVPGGGRACDEDEEIEVLRVRPEELLRVDPGDAKTMVAALLLMARSARVRPTLASETRDEGEAPLTQ